MDSKITSLQNPRIRQALRLRTRRGRQQQGRMIIDGGREILRAGDARCAIREVYFCPDDKAALMAGSWQNQLIEQDFPMIPVTASIMEKLAYGQRTDGIVAVADLPPDRSLAAWQPPERGLVAVLEAVEKPGNVGALVRTADAAGISAMILADAASDLYSPNAIRASVGTVFSFPVFRETSADTLCWLQEHEFHVWSCCVDGKRDYREVDWTARSALVLGSEANGLSDQWQAEGIGLVVLPMLGIADSLNVSITGAILFYEALRQRQQ